VVVQLLVVRHRHSQLSVAQLLVVRCTGRVSLGQSSLARDTPAVVRRPYGLGGPFISGPCDSSYGQYVRLYWPLPSTVVVIGDDMRTTSPSQEMTINSSKETKRKRKEEDTGSSV